MNPHAGPIIRAETKQKPFEAKRILLAYQPVGWALPSDHHGSCQTDCPCQPSLFGKYVLIATSTGSASYC